jgi:siroheme decarboxylase
MPDWSYNLFAMVHGRDRDEVEEKTAQIAVLLGVHCQAHTTLYSTKILKKTGLRI